MGRLGRFRQPLSGTKAFGCALRESLPEGGGNRVVPRECRIPSLVGTGFLYIERLFVMFRSVNSRVNLPQVEENILNFWEKNNVFEKSIESRRDGSRS